MKRGRWTAAVINYNGGPFLDACMLALGRTSPPPADILVIDNASTDDSLEELIAFPHANVLAQQRNLGFAGAANVALEQVDTDLIVLLNPDVEVGETFGAELEAAFDGRPRLAAAGPLLLYPDERTIQHAGGIVDRPLMTTRHRGYGSTDLAAYADEFEVDFVTGGAMGLRVSAVRAIGGFDERFVPAYYEDVDLCARLRAAGWAVRFIPGLRAVHHEGSTLHRSPAYYRFLHANRLRYALKYLSPREWSDEFVPAEVARLRHELIELSGPDWPELSGAAGIEAAVRNPEVGAGWVDAAAFLGEFLTGIAPSLNVARHAAAIPPPPEPEPRREGLRDRFGAPSERSSEWFAWVENILAQQATFNDAVVAALATQERLNREQVALALILALDLMGQLRTRVTPEMGERHAE